jgi:hypothetical protein
MYLRRLEIENLRSFERVVFEPNVPEEGDLRHPNVTLLLGNNGQGKTSLLRGVALAVLAPLLASSSGFVPYALVRRSGKSSRHARVKATVALHPEHGEGARGSRTLGLNLVPTKGSFVDRAVSTVAPELAEAMWDGTSPAFLVVGYGASRRTESKDALGEQMRLKARALRYGRVASLFEEGVSMVPLGMWLPSLRQRNPHRHAQVIALLDQLLPGVEILPEPVRGEYVFRRNGSDLPFDALSDGYRTYIGWVADLLYHISMGAPYGTKLVDARGIVLVDEVDLHLHPDWQTTVVPTLAETFPKLQFILTSHSPLVAGTLHRRSVRTLIRDPRSRKNASTLTVPADGSLESNAESFAASHPFGDEGPINDLAPPSVRKPQPAAVAAPVEPPPPASTRKVKRAASSAQKLAPKAKVTSSTKATAKPAPKSSPRATVKAAAKTSTAPLRKKLASAR